ncbi:DNA modification methylase [Verrucomicrobia phage P8625]|uniref:DNA methyltransferase n=1 Tax=Verrucomicrobia phage P8625 TaxID=1636271 RepID=UPI0005FEB661|nr:DNA methyltransferase [Verrucomicrobia phage P8625]AKA60254.1 DNA modification methylase [Verrucomicrobia phage P8625]
MTSRVFERESKNRKTMIQKIKSIKTDTLIPYAGNSRTHSAEQVAQIAASIKEFGFNNPVLIDADNGIIAGHGRLLAAQKLGMDEVPTICLDHLNDAQRRAYVIADNKLALNAGWDDEALQAELDRLRDEDFDLDLLGFSDEEIDAFIQDMETEELTDEDEVPEAPEQPVTVEGDVWLLGRHRLMCGDSTSIDAVEKLMDGNEWDVCVFDPPYELEHLYSEAMPIAEPGKKLAVMWDFKRFGIAAHKAISAGWNPLYELIWDCVQSWYTPNRPLARHKAMGIFGEDPFFDTEKAIIEDGKNRQAKTVSNTRGKCEYVPLDGAKHIATVESFPNTAEKDTHGHGKPIKWIEAIFNGIGGSVYLDLFGGSGSTMIACEKKARECRMMELNPKYCDVIIKRWQDFTGQNATNKATGKTFADIEAKMKGILIDG